MRAIALQTLSRGNSCRLRIYYTVEPPIAEPGKGGVSKCTELSGLIRANRCGILCESLLASKKKKKNNLFANQPSRKWITARTGRESREFQCESLLWPIRGQEAREYQGLGPPNEAGPLAFSHRCPSGHLRSSVAKDLRCSICHRCDCAWSSARATPTRGRQTSSFVILGTSQKPLNPE